MPFDVPGALDTINEGAAAPEAIKSSRARKAPKAAPPRLPQPGEESHTHVGPDGRLCVGVWLDGAGGGGQRAVVNLADWTRVKVAYGARWTLRSPKPGYAYVVGMAPSAGVTLARVLCGAGAAETVALKDGDPLNLCRGNLEVMAAGEFVARSLGRRRGKVTHGFRSATQAAEPVGQAGTGVN